MSIFVVWYEQGHSWVKEESVFKYLTCIHIPTLFKLNKTKNWHWHAWIGIQFYPCFWRVLSTVRNASTNLQTPSDIHSQKLDQHYILTIYSKLVMIILWKKKSMISNHILPAGGIKSQDYNYSIKDGLLIKMPI